MIDTERLTLRGWIDSDHGPFHAMGQDAEVMRYLGPPMSEAEVRAAARRQNGFLAEFGHCFWALERKEDGAFLGFCGVKPGAIGTPIEGRIEIGWRLARAHWGRGYAHEAAQASLEWCWANLRGDSVWAIASAGNVRSRGLMERLGLRRRKDLDFGGLEAGPVAHVTYQIARRA